MSLSTAKRFARWAMLRRMRGCYVLADIHLIALNLPSITHVTL